MSRKFPTREERFAASVIEHASRWGVDFAEDGRTQRQVDLWLFEGQRLVGAVEVTRLGDEAMFQADAASGNVYWRIPAARWAWVLNYDAETDFREVRKHVPSLIQVCEANGVRDPDQLPPDSVDPDALKWYEGSSAELFGVPESTRSGVVDVLRSGFGGAVNEDLEPLVPWLESQFEGKLRSKLKKLTSTGLDQRHLFVLVDETSMPFSLFDPLAFGNVVPADGPGRGSGLTGLWLAPSWGGTILVWDRDVGWRRLPQADSTTGSSGRE